MQCIKNCENADDLLCKLLRIENNTGVKLDNQLGLVLHR
jgi:hypothetical protein